MATVRLRRVFRYPEDSDGEHDREELDEEEQERVIKQLQSLDSKRNAGYSMNITDNLHSNPFNFCGCFHSTHIIRVTHVI